MEKKTLLEFEKKCVQEEPPRCQAACPLHLDGRGLCAAVGKGDLAEARRLIEKTLPLPGILARICDAPCRNSCLRMEAGGAIELGALERFCAGSGPFRRLPLLVPRNGRTAAVLGGGIASLTAALDGIKKGYSITLFRSRSEIRQFLLDLSPLLTNTIIDEELDWLEKNGTVLRPFEDGAPPAELSGMFHSVFVGMDDPAAGGYPGLQERHDPITLETSLPGVFAGGDSGSFIERAAAGRRGMKSIERFLQGASLTTSREKEGPFHTRLFTNVEGVAPKPPVPVSTGGYSPEEAAAEAGRCLLCECMECVKHCEFLQHYKGYPKKYAREIYNNLSIVQGTRLANRMINSCALCGQCERICPNGFSMRDLCLGARKEMLLQQKMPPSAHEFALEDMVFSNSPSASLLRPEPGRRETAWLFYPGCRLSGTSPSQVRDAYGFLRNFLEGGVGLWLRCCGAPARWAGREDLFRKEAEETLRIWKSMGSPVIIAACTGCVDVFRRELPEIRVVSLWEVLEKEAMPEEFLKMNGTLAVHDPCTAVDYPEIRRAARSMASRAGIDCEELPMTAELTSCCGYGGLQECANPELGSATASSRCGESSSDYLVYCAMCRTLFARTGKRTVHLLEVLFPAPGKDPLSMPAVSWSDQRENRAGLVRELLGTLWKEESPMPEEHEAIKLVLPEDAGKILETRRILTDTVKRAIRNGENSGRKIERPDGAFVTCLKPASVTYWVVYRPLEDGAFEVLNAWSHRMTVPGTEGSLP